MNNKTILNIENLKTIIIKLINNKIILKCRIVNICRIILINNIITFVICKFEHIIKMILICNKITFIINNIIKIVKIINYLKHINKLHTFENVYINLSIKNMNTIYIYILVYIWLRSNIIVYNWEVKIIMKRIKKK